MDNGPTNDLGVKGAKISTMMLTFFTTTFLYHKNTFALSVISKLWDGTDGWKFFLMEGKDRLILQMAADGLGPLLLTEFNFNPSMAS